MISNTAYKDILKITRFVYKLNRFELKKKSFDPNRKIEQKIKILLE